jgi:hypothetical protein
MSIPRGYVPNHKFWDRMGRVTPNVEKSESVRPFFESMPAVWLPVGRYEKELETYFVVSSGKVVAEDRQGFMVPAGLRKAWNIAAGNAALSYVAADVTEGVIDLTTGVAVTAAVSYTEAQLTAALRLRGLIDPAERATDFISKPVGIASYNYYKASGTDWYNPATLFQHDFRPQATVAITCDYVITLPVLPAVTTAEAMANDNTSGAANLLSEIFAGNSNRTKGWFNATQIHAVTRFASEVATTDSVVAYLTTSAPIAQVTPDSLITASVAGLVNHVASISQLSAAGDFFVDYEAGIVFVFEAGGNAIPSPFATASTLTYSNYAAAGSNVSTFACATGNLEFGDFLTYDANSNLIKATLDIGTAEGYDAGGNLFAADPDYSNASDASISLQIEKAVLNFVEGIVGQVIGTEIFPRDLLDRVATAYAGQSAANMRTPGSATGGRTDQLTYANAAEKMVLVNLILR